MKKRVMTMVAAIALVGVLAGCTGGSKSSGPVETIDLTANAMAFGSKEITIEKGKAYKLVFKNDDSVEHDFSVKKIPVKLTKKDDHGHGSADLHVHADGGKTESVEFTATEAGSYEFICTVAGHKDAGMTGKLIVK